ncbi:exodeoxyribonuclease VII small subunit [Microvirga sp. ACRRW]|uniref:exodeoxyribonuclease VII small subunit n=1 Tax=Microvirga sp. ACRRW TaxID=2918205 RepID=UPI001EF62EF0|nr:exodeoxyribonuclease VII small subunit [Microvirga sp. ACRRW]MCG7392651.1 exodeoxyribonuclease VII small subunit [Microvirga sp. ACRRW]
MSNQNDNSSKPTTSRLYAEHYAKLREIAERLRTGGPDDVDRLVEDFRTAMAAYDVCKVRLDAIRAEIDSELTRNQPL